MNIRQAKTTDLPAIRALFRNTIQQVNKRDYSPEQIAIWSATADDKTKWLARFDSQHFLVAEQDDKTVGFTSLDESTGYLDLLYVHHQFQGQGIGKALLQAIIQHAKTIDLQRLTTEASITAKPLFEKLGFTVITPQDKELGGLVFRNYVMELEVKEG